MNILDNCPFEVVNLKKDRATIKTYMKLRNDAAALLTSEPVTYSATLQWLDSTDAELYGLLDAGTLVGVVILYTARNGELAFASDNSGGGKGKQLLALAADVAKKVGILNIWCWTRADNNAAKKVLEQSGYHQSETVDRSYRGEAVKGIIYRKEIL